MTGKPQLTRAIYAHRDVCPCGYGFLRDEIPLGSIYHVDLKRADVLTLICGGCGGTVRNLKCAWARSERTGHTGMMALCILDFTSHESPVPCLASQT